MRKLLLSSLLTIVLSTALIGGVADAAVGQTIRYNFRAASEPTVAGWEDVFHPSDDASLGEVVVTTGGRSLVTNPLGWTPIFGATAFADNGQVGSDTGFILSPFAEYHLHGKFAYGVPLFPDTNAEFYLTGLYFPSYQSDGFDAFDIGVFESNWSTQVAFNPYGPPPSNVLFTGLDPSKVYTFKIAGSLEDTAAPFLQGTTVYAVGDVNNTALLNTKGNTSHYITFAGVAPNASGEIPVWANAAWNPQGYVGLLGGIEIIESDAVDVPDIDFGTGEFRVYTPDNSITISPNVTVGGGASIVSYSWRQIQGPQQTSIITPFANSTQIIGMNDRGVYVFELSVKADNGIEHRERIRVVIDSGNWVEKIIPNGNPPINNGQDIEYLEYLPDDYNTTGCENKKYPVIIYLHGFGQNGRDTEMLKGEGLGYLVDAGLTNLQFTGASGQLEKFIALMPQLSTNTAWDTDDIDGFMAYVMNSLNYRIDYNRVYIVGFSYGSLGLWNYLSTPGKSDQFAAAVPSAFVPTRGPAYCNTNGVQIYALSEADMVAAGYYISSPTDFTNFMNDLALCPINPAAIGQVMTGRDHVEMYNFFWQESYTGFEGKNIFEWFLDHERNYTSGGAGDSCFVPNPIIDLSISPSIQTVSSGDNASFTVTLLNTGNIALTGIVITSSMPGCSSSFEYLDMGATTGYTCNVTTITSGFTNDFTVTGYAYSGGVTYSGHSTVDTGSSLVNVDVLAPSILITQTPLSQNILSGDTANFTITIINTGNVALSGITIVNPTHPTCDNTIGLLGIGASTGYNCSINNIIADFVTTSYVTGYAYTGGITYMSDVTSANAISTVTVVHYLPQLSLVVAPSTQTINEGDIASFTVTVGNSGNVDMTGIVVDVPLVSGCSVAIGGLAQGSSTGYTCQQTNVLASFSPQFTSSGYATSGGIDYPTNTSLQNQTVTVTVNPITPPPVIPAAQLSLVVTPLTQTINEGDTASFVVTVGNSGNVDMTGIVVDVPLVAACNATIGGLVQGSVASFACQQTNVLASFSPQFTSSGYATSGGVDYPLNISSQNQSVTVTVNPNTPPPPPVTPPTGGGYGSFAGGGNTTSIQSLSTLGSSSTSTQSLSTLPKSPSQNTTNTTSNTEPTIITQIPNDTALPSAPLTSQMGGAGSQPSLGDPATNGSDAFALPFASLWELLSGLLSM